MAGIMQYTDMPGRQENVRISSQLFDKPDQARAYSKCRPEPPQELLDIIISYLSEKFPRPFDQAVDVGCGTGQSTIVLAPYFRSVCGCDISKSQIQEAEYYRKASNVQYSIASAECLPVGDQSVQLLTAATCFHWLDFQAFFKEADRVLVPEGVLAIYSSVNIRPVCEDEEKDFQLRRLTDKFLYEDLAPYRSSRLHQEYEQFSNVEFPFDDIIKVQDISQTFWGSAADAVGYIQSMSTFQTFRAVNLREADKLLHNYQCSIMDILEDNTTPERKPLAYRKDYFLILCRRRTQIKNLK